MKRDKFRAKYWKREESIPEVKEHTEETPEEFVENYNKRKI